MNQLFRTALKPEIVKNAIKVSVVVGTILNIINHGRALLDGAPLIWTHLLLNYFVPYCVASYSAAKNELSRNAADGFCRDK